VPPLPLSSGGRRRPSVPTGQGKAVRVVAPPPGHSIRRRRGGKRVDLPVLHLGRKVSCLFVKKKLLGINFIPLDLGTKTQRMEKRGAAAVGGAT